MYLIYKVIKPFYFKGKKLGLRDYINIDPNELGVKIRRQMLKQAADQNGAAKLVTYDFTPKKKEDKPKEKKDVKKI